MKTKTEPSRNVTYSCGIVQYDYRTNTFNPTAQVGSNSITYEEGPKYICVDGSKICNWKTCVHTRGVQLTGVQATAMRYDRYGHSFGFPDFPFGLIDLPAVTYPDDPVSPINDVLDELYTDIAGRTNQFLLSLEDLAGLFSGHSLYKSIRGTASAINMLSKSVKDIRRLAKAFGVRNSLYNCWLSSKAAVSQILGLRLGYRFSFKTALHDISRAVDFATQFSRYSAQIAYRNSSEFLRYSKTKSVNSSAIVSYPYETWSSWCDTLTRKSWWRSSIKFKTWMGGVSGEDVPMVREYGMRKSATAFAMAKVRYPLEYGTLKHFLESRFGFDKPLTTIWAIVPMSFVIDYLVNVQDMLTYVDNKLSDYLVGVRFANAWTCEKSYRFDKFDTNKVYRRRDDGMFWYEIPPLHFEKKWGQEFRRHPISTSALRAQFPPLLAASQGNWVNGVGTGLELLLSR